MKRILISFAAVAALAALPAGLVRAADTFKGQELAKSAKLSIEEARSIALKVRPGQIKEEELEKEKGGSGLRYSFDVLSKGTKYEVGVDAITGNVLENGHEGLVSEAGEAITEGTGRAADVFKKKSP